MIFEDRTYSVLIVSSSEKITSSLTPLLQKVSHDPVSRVSSIAAAKRAMNDRLYDLVIINSPLTDDVGTEFAIETTENKNSVVLMLVKAEAESAIEAKTSMFGVLTLPKPTNSQMLGTAVRWMVAIRERLRSFEQRTLTIEEKMKEIRTVNRAKWLLIENLSMTESQAHRYIEKQAMDRCISKVKFAEGIIETYT